MRPSDSPQSVDAALASLDHAEPAMRQLVETWCAQNSGSAHIAGLEAMRAILAAAFSHLGGEIEYLDAALVTQFDGTPRETGGALRISKHPSASRQVVLSGHMDTVFGPDSAFQRCSEARPGILNGPGAADMKGGLVVMLKVLETLEASPWAGRLGWTVLIVGDEETGSLGSKEIIAETAAGKDLALVFECAQPGGAMVGERKGSAICRARALGRETHTGRDFEIGRNAIVLLSEFVIGLHRLNDRFPGYSINVGKIRGGTVGNIVPALAEAEVNVRLPAGADFAAFLDAVECIRRPLAAREGFELRFDGRVLRGPMELDLRRWPWIERFQAAARAEGVEIGLRDTGGGSDGNVFHAAGVPVLDGIGLRGGSLHSADEFLELDSLVERARVIARFLMELAKEPG